MSALFWLSFLFSSHSPPCSTQGTPLLEIREGSDTSSAVTTKKIYNSGAWTLTSDSESARGCFSKKEIRGIRQALQHARWKVTQSPIACFAYDPHFTQYWLNGKLRYTDRMCSGKRADDDTRDALDLVQRELLDDMPPAPPAPPVANPPTHPAPAAPPISVLPATPVADPPVVAPPPSPVKPSAPPSSPVKPSTPPTAQLPVLIPPPAPPSSPVRPPPLNACRPVGVPLFEIRHRSDAKDATSTIKIYSTGAWTFLPIDQDGKAGALTTGCFDKPTLSAIRAAVDHAPWDVTFDRIVCRAYSATFTDYYVHGKLEYTQRLCNGQRLDDASAAALKKIETEMSTLLPKPDSVSVRDHRQPAPQDSLNVRDHREPATSRIDVRDHREPATSPVDERDHREPAPAPVAVRDHRSEPAPMPAPVVVRDHRAL
jgi:hypothetical protein